MKLPAVLHGFVYTSRTLDKPGVGVLVVCADRLRRKVHHASFCPALDPVRHDVPLDRISAIVAATSAAVAVRALGGDRP